MTNPQPRVGGTTAASRSGAARKNGIATAAWGRWTSPKGSSAPPVLVGDEQVLVAGQVREELELNSLLDGTFE